MRNLFFTPIFFSLLFLVNTTYSQNFNEKERNKLETLNINIERLDLTDLNLQLNLKNILKLERKRNLTKLLL